MEPSAIDKKPQGRKGSLANPEVIENVPGHVIPILQREFDDFDSEASRFLAGESDPDEFVGFRLRQGVYGQRQPDVHMIRVKCPFGGVTPENMESFAEVADRYTPLRKGHITTRQNIQFHHIPLTDAAQAIRLISESGLSTREACGNTIRNVSGDPWAGVCEGELFDPTPYAGAYVRYFVRHELTQLMPRKVKTAFTATDEDRAITGIHDIAFIPRIREVDGDQVKGFEMRVGGGTSIMPRVAPTLYEFVSVDDYLKVTEAVVRVFNRQEDLRKNRLRARIKFYIDRIGIDAFREEVEAELDGDWANGHDFSPDPMLFVDDEQAQAPPVPDGYSTPDGDRGDFDRFLEANVQPQRQDGFSTVEVKVARGDITPEQFRGLAAIMREFTGGYARTSIQQNLVLRWVRDESVYDLWLRLGELDLADAGANQVSDVVSCPGTDSCKLGITSSMGLNAVVQERIEQMDIDDPLTKQIHVKMSGCPNGCSQHHIATIGFYGAAMKIGDRQLPAYIAHLGGNYDGGTVRMGKRLKHRFPAKRVPEAVERFIRFYEGNREDAEPFNDFVDRVGAEAFEEQAKELGIAPAFNLENMNMFMDWNRTDPYKVERGEGECAI